MDATQFVMPDALYAQQVAQASGGAMPAAGMAPYPLYGVPPLGQSATPTEPEVPFYRRNWFWAAVGAGAVGVAWAYFGWWRPRGGVKANRGTWKQLQGGIWEMRQGEESVARVFNSGEDWTWIADFQPEGGRYRSKVGSATSPESAKRDAERWLFRSMSGGAHRAL